MNNKSDILILSFLFTLTTSLLVSDFKTGIFKSSQPTGFWPVSTGSYSPSGQIILAYADFNSDKYTDIVCMNNTKNGISIFLWDNGKSIFIENSQININQVIESVVSVIPADYNNDGRMDLLLVYNVSYTGQYFFDIEIQINNNCNNLNCQFNNNFTQSQSLLKKLDPIQPFLLNPNGTSKYIIVCQRGGARMVLVYQNSTFTLNNFAIYVQNSSNLNFPPLSTNHFASIIDYNGDCVSDLILVAGQSNLQYIEFYKLNPSGLYQLDKNVTLNYTLKKLSFADINYDGVTDLIMIILDSNGAYNLQINYNKNSVSSVCQTYSSFPFDFYLDSNAITYIQILNLPYGIVNITNLNFGDANTDGYPDIVLVMNVSNYNKPVLLINRQCTGGSCGDFNPGFITTYKNLRTFVYDSGMSNIIRDTSLATSVSFFDLGEDGRLDIIINSMQYGSNDQISYSISCIFNNLNEDTFFIKALPLTKYSDDDNNQIINEFGVTFNWKITTLEGNYKISVINQLFQQTGRALQLPFVSVGLGRTNNYLQDFTVCYDGSNNKQIWTPIIPNSQLLIVPYGSPNEWQLAIYVSQSEKIIQVVIITVIILAIIGIFIIYLNYKQAEEDKKNQFMFFQLIR